MLALTAAWGTGDDPNASRKRICAPSTRVSVGIVRFACRLALGVYARSSIYDGAVRRWDTNFDWDTIFVMGYDLCVGRLASLTRVTAISPTFLRPN